MGEGIMGVIPITFSVERPNNLPESYLQNYTVTKNRKKEKIYKIKKELLYENFADLIVRTNEMLNRNEPLWIFKRWDDFNKFIAKDDFEGVLEFLSKESNRSNPSYYDSSYASDASLEIFADILICNGSFKAFLEEYVTLRHLNILFSKVFADNPLSATVRFVMWG
jgi:hypothetical protein